MKKMAIFSGVLGILVCMAIGFVIASLYGMIVAMIFGLVMLTVYIRIEDLHVKQDNALDRLEEIYELCKRSDRTEPPRTLFQRCPKCHNRYDANAEACPFCHPTN